LLSSSQSLLGLRAITTKVVDGVYTGVSNFLYIVNFGGRGMRLRGSTLEGDNRPSLGKFGFELGNDEVSCKVCDAKNGGNADVLGTGV
jgi:hypothetical protein